MILTRPMSEEGFRKFMDLLARNEDLNFPVNTWDPTYLNCGDVQYGRFWFHQDQTYILNDTQYLRDFEEELRESRIWHTPHFTMESGEGGLLRGLSEVFSIHIDGSMLIPGQDYEVVGNSIRFLNSEIPILGHAVEIQGR